MRDMKQYSLLAIEAAKMAGKLISTTTPSNIRHKGTIDFVSSVDEASEELLRAFFAKNTPEFAVHAEEGGGADHIDTRWIIDPLDGTTNFLHNFPAYCVSIALQIEGTICVGVIFNPVNHELFYATKNGGAFCNDHRIQCSQKSSLDHALLATGFPYDRREKSDFYLDYFQRFLVRTRGIRRMGSAALDLANVACGRIDGFWEFGLKAWDVAAGALLIEEAGGLCTQMDGSVLDINQPKILAATPSVWKEMKTIIDFPTIV
jgi:myo-inositol-1(or 4)-monophosphatase